MERTCNSPGTLLTASSIGRVTVTVIWSMGMTPLSTPINTRGKLVDGKTETGIVKARYAPSKARVRIRKIIGREWRETQWSDFFKFTQWLRGSYLSLGASLGETFLAGSFLVRSFLGESSPESWEESFAPLTPES